MVTTRLMPASERARAPASQPAASQPASERARACPSQDEGQWRWTEQDGRRKV